MYTYSKGQKREEQWGCKVQEHKRGQEAGAREQTVMRHGEAGAEDGWRTGAADEVARSSNTHSGRQGHNDLLSLDLPPVDATLQGSAIAPPFFSPGSK